MPEISRFLGIIITMNFSDHNPPHYDLKNIEYQHDYVYKVAFEDGTSGLVDFADVINSVKPYDVLTNMNLFKNAYIHPELKTLTWTEDLDYDPILLYYKANNIAFPTSWGEIS